MIFFNKTEQQTTTKYMHCVFWYVTPILQLLEHANAMGPIDSKRFIWKANRKYTKCFTSLAQRNMSGYWCQTCSYLRSSRTTTTYSPFSSLRSWPRARRLWTAAWDFSRFSAYLALSSWTQQLFRCSLQALGDERSAHLWVVHPLRWREEDHEGAGHQGAQRRHLHPQQGGPHSRQHDQAPAAQGPKCDLFGVQKPKSVWKQG